MSVTVLSVRGFASRGAASPLPPEPSPSTIDASAAAADSTPYLDFIDKVWNTKWFGSVDDIAPAASSSEAASSCFTDLFLSCQSVLGVDPWVVILLFGALTRLSTLYFSLYGERATERMQLALPELKAPQEAFNRVYYNDTSSSLDVQLSASVLKGERRRVFAKFKTSNVKCLASFVSAPFILGGLYQTSALCENLLLDVGASSFFWCTALTLPDPLCILPITFCALTLLNFELSVRPEMKKGWMSNVIWGARLACLCVVPVASTFRAGVCLYFIGMSVSGLLQPLLLRWPAFRSWFAFPTAAERAAAESASQGSVDALQARVTVQFPYLSHLLNPEVEEEGAPLMKKASPASRRAYASTSSAFPSPASRGAASGRYAMGSNPLMQETPQRRAARTGGATHTAQATTTMTSGASARAAAAKPGKGSSFASSGWKEAQISFSEEDFIPADPTDASAKRRR